MTTALASFPSPAGGAGRDSCDTIGAVFRSNGSNFKHSSDLILTKCPLFCRGGFARSPWLAWTAWWQWNKPKNPVKVSEHILKNLYSKFLSCIVDFEQGAEMQQTFSNIETSAAVPISTVPSVPPFLGQPEGDGKSRNRRDDDVDMRRTEINAPKGLRGRERGDGETESCLGRKIRPSELRQEEERGRESRFSSGFGGDRDSERQKVHKKGLSSGRSPFPSVLSLAPYL